ncbi:MAG: hypothetical protein N4A32_06120 [Marinifilaceae bacterium]|jgi:hypothetical protein|nr:hypothetical protein [Marinilabiliaceae bacterium JC040]MCT4600457.1 hypothetical protein [Marinifilaceae bacterium]
MKQKLLLFRKIFRYNQKIVFANKFIYFLLAALGFFIIVATLQLFFNPIFNEEVLFGTIYIPAILLIFYPACFGIQNDQDSKIIEVLFGIPNYRYKIWLTRLLMMYAVSVLILFAILLFSNITMVDCNPLMMTINIFFPMFFVGNLAFFLSTKTRSGNGTAVIVIIICFLLFVISDLLRESKWNLFLNPYLDNTDVNHIVWAKVLIKNKIFSLTLSTVLLIGGLLNLQNREKFI